MVKCEATLTEWQGVAVCEECDWNENGSDYPHGVRTAQMVLDEACCDPRQGGCPVCDPIAFPSAEDIYGGRRAAQMVNDVEDYGDVAGEYEMYGCPDCGTYCGEWGCDPAPAVRDGWEAIRDYCGPCLEGDGPCQGEGCGEWCTVQRSDRVTRCRHGIDSAQCVTCTGKRDEFASYRKADGEGRYVKPYAQLPATVRGAFGIGQVRDVVPSVETTVRQWTTAESAPDWCAETPTVKRPPATTHVRPTGVPMWYQVYERGVTPTWPDPDAYDRDAYFADHRERCEWGPVVRPT